MSLGEWVATLQEFQLPVATRGDGVLGDADQGHFSCLVTGTTEITERFRRVHLCSPGLLATAVLHPTFWARFWFSQGHRSHQRAYTIINAEPSLGTFDIDVHLHEGIGARWAQSTGAGQTVQATLQRKDFAAPRVGVTHMHLVGDASSIPAIRSIVSAFPSTHATLWLEEQHESEASISLNLRPGDDVVRVKRGDGTHLFDAVRDGLAARWSAAEVKQQWFWLACEASANRALVVHLRGDKGIARSHIAAKAYWRA